MTGELARQPAIFTIAPRYAFADALASGLLERFADDPLALSRAKILVPTRRAARALRDAFSRVSDGRPLLLPELRALGDVDEEELDLNAPAVADFGDLDVPPAIEPMHRMLLLTRLTAGDSGVLTIAQAAPLARELARLLDQVATERLSLDGLGGLVPAEYALHWQKTLDFLSIISEHWPRILEERGVIDAARRRNRLIERQTEDWRRQPHDGPVIAAGSTGSIPATAELLGVIARLPQGAVVLPGLDLEMDQRSWDELEPSHPQFGMKQLLGRIDASRGDVDEWRFPEPDPGTAGHASRTALIAEAMRPAATTEAWSGLGILDPAAIEGLERVDAPTPREEAGVIALMMRQALETPGRTAALVTPDRKLGRRVAAELRRWDIEIDDSAGRPLSQTPPGTFMGLLARMTLDQAAPAPLLALLKHPLAAGGTSPRTFRAMARRLEIKLLRGPRPAPGIAGLTAALSNHRKPDPQLLAWLRGLGAILEPLARAMASAKPSLAGLLSGHIAVAEGLAASDTEPGENRLWAGHAGQVAARFFADIAAAADCLPEIDGPGYLALLEGLMAGQVVRPRFGLHPRLHIWGPLEARLQQADLVILGGLNEGVWPAGAGADPWLSRPMRAAFGLPSPERGIGLSAHDFAQLAAAPRVVLTRSEKVDGTPMVPSRWLQRLQNLLESPLGARDPWLDWLERLDRPEAVRPVPPPSPRPPLDARPGRLSVTQVETWMRDPYAIFARHILKLEALDPIDADPGAAEHGSFVHQALDAFIRAHPKDLPGDALERLIDCGRQAFGDALARPAVWSFWWPRFCRIAAWFVDHQRKTSHLSLPIATEVKGKLDLVTAAGAFTLTAKADRIDRLASGDLAIIDYKTGMPPSAKQVAAGFAPQLPLEAYMATQGAFEGIDAGAVGALVYWRLRGRDPVAEIKPIKGDSDDLALSARDGLIALVETFADPSTPYLSRPRPAHAGYGDYDHLARVKEWSASSGGGE